MLLECTKDQARCEEPRSPSLDCMFEVIRLWAYCNSLKVCFYPYSTSRGVHFVVKVLNDRGPIWFGIGRSPENLFLNLCKDFGLEVRS